MGLWARRWGDFLVRLRALARGTTLTALPSSPENCSSRPTSQRFSRQRNAAAAQFAGTTGDVSGRRNCNRWACRCISSKFGAAGIAQPSPVSMPHPRLAGPSSKGAHCPCPFGKAKAMCPRGKKSRAGPSRFSHPGSVGPCPGYCPTQDLLGSRLINKPQRENVPSDSGPAHLPPDFCSYFCSIVHLPGILPARRPMVYNALQHFALSLLGLRGASQALDIFRHVLDAVLQTGLFCEADG